MPLIQILGVSTKPIDSRAGMAWALDSPVDAELFDGDGLELRGWFVASTQTDAIEVVCDGQLIHRVQTDGVRNDVAHLYSNLYRPDRSGFQASIPLTSWKETHITVSAALRSNQPVPFASVRARRTWREAVQPGDVAFVSFIIAGGGSDQLGITLDSLLRQTYPHFEIIFIGDLSTRSAQETASRCGSLRIIEHGDPDPVVAWNAGLRRSTGDHLLFLREGEELRPNAIQCALDAFLEHPESPLVRDLPSGLFRRSVFDCVPGFQVGVDPRADLYARLTEQFPVCG